MTCTLQTLSSTRSPSTGSWRHPRSRHWHQLDLVITRRDSLNCVCNTRSYHNADCDMDHSLVASRVRKEPKRIHNSKQEGRHRINTTLISVPDACVRLVSTLQEALKDCPTYTSNERWGHIRAANYNSVMDTFDKRDKKNPNWFETGITELQPVILANCTALLEHKRYPSEKTLAALRKARSDAQKTAQRCASDY